MTAPTYQQRDDLALHRDLTKAANQYLLQRHDHRFADGWMIGKLLCLLALCGLFYTTALLSGEPVIFACGYFAFIFTAMLLAINAVHDASHNAFFRQAWANRALNFVICIPLGLDADCWRVRHVECHHAHLNVQGYDLDIEENGVLRQTPFQRIKRFMQAQQYYWPFVAALTFPCIIWFFDWIDRAGKTRVQPKMRHQGVRGWGVFLTAKTLHLLLALALPYWILRQQGIGGDTLLWCYLAGQMLSSLIFVVLILGSHWAMGTFYEVPEDGHFQHGRYRHVFATTIDWVPSPRWLSYWMGELNRHLTHHIFPNWNHRHYPALSDIIAQVTQRHGVTYHCVSLKEILIAQQRFLRAMGKGETATGLMDKPTDNSQSPDC